MPTKNSLRALPKRLTTAISAFVKRAGFSSFCAGSISFLSLPPYHCWPALFIGFCWLAVLLNKTTGKKKAFWLGFCFGFAHFAFGLAWVSNALLVDARFAWLAPFPPVGLGLWGAFFPALCCLFAVMIAAAGFWRIVAFAGLWGVFEWVRSWLFTGFPWNLTATSFVDMPVLIQTAAFWGSYGVGMIAVLAACLPALFFADKTAGKRAFLIKSVRYFLPSVLIVCAVSGIGAWRLSRAFALDDFVRGIRFRLVQANIPQNNKWNQRKAERILDEHVHLSAQLASAKDVTHVVWPETATQFLLPEDDYARAMAVSGLSEGAILLAGTLRSEKDETPDAYPPYKVFNSIVAVNDIGSVLALYDKSHLVPFGEYAPLKKLFPFMRKFTPGSFDFSAGERIRTVDVPRTPPVGMLVCYEIIFPAHVVDKDRRPYWLLNVTNDGWYGISAGPFQHFAAARMRAVEEGLPVVRSANTGISGVIDSFGRVSSVLELGRTGFKDALLPRALPDATFYGRFGNAVPLTMAALLILFSFFGSKMTRRKKEMPL